MEMFLLNLMISILIFGSVGYVVVRVGVMHALRKWQQEQEASQSEAATPAQLPGTAHPRLWQE